MHTESNEKLNYPSYFTLANDQMLMDLVLKCPKLIECMKSSLPNPDEDYLWDEITKMFNSIPNKFKFTREILKDRWKLLKASLATNKHLFENRPLTMEMKIALENISSESTDTLVTIENMPVLNKAQQLLESKVEFMKDLPIDQLHSLEQEIYEMLVDYELEAKGEWEQITESQMETVINECEEIFKELNIFSKPEIAPRIKSEWDTDSEPITNMENAGLVEAVLDDNEMIPSPSKRKTINLKKVAITKVPLSEANNYARKFTIRLKKNFGDQFSLRRLRPRRTLNTSI